VKRLVAVLLLVAGMYSPGWAQNLSQRAFTEEIAKALRSAVPSARITIPKNLEIRIRYAGGEDFTAVLTTAYRLYREGSESLDKIIGVHISKYSTPMAPQEAAKYASLDPASIVPIIKNRKWLAEFEQRSKAAGVTQEQLADSFVEDLVVAYAEDTRQMFRYITANEYKGKREDLRPLAVNNVRRLSPNIEMRFMGEELIAVSAGDDYTSSLLLVDEVWSNKELKVKGEMVVAIPVRDVILVIGSRSTKLKEFRDVVAELYAKGPNAISQTLLVYRDKRFTKFAGN
jgi:uncharacterized protein YtpQ (UPF0354 family)